MLSLRVFVQIALVIVGLGVREIMAYSVTARLFSWGMFVAEPYPLRRIANACRILLAAGSAQHPIFA